MSEAIAIKTEQFPAPTPVESSNALISMIERVALNPDADIDKMERLMSMHERALERQSVVAYRRDMALAQAEMEPIARKHRNNQTNSNYAKLEDVYREITPVMKKYGFALSFGNGKSDKDGFYLVTCKVMHRDGHMEIEPAYVPIDDAGIKGTVNKTPMHAFGSSMSYARRYMTLGIFNLAMKDDDGQAASRKVECVTQEQADELNKLADDLGIDKIKFCKFGNVPSIAEIPANQFEAAKKMMLEKGAKHATAN